MSMQEALQRLDPDLREILSTGGHATEWDQHIGQDKAKKILRRAAASARMRDAFMGHVLLAAPAAGIGKTSLALLTGLEVGRGIIMASGKVTIHDMRSLLADAQDGDVLILDEIHMLVSGGKANSEWLLPYMQNGLLIGPNGPEDYPRVTIIGTTTNAGALPGPVRERFVYQPPLDSYTDLEAARIAVMHCDKLFPNEVLLPDANTARALALAGANRPRVIRSLCMTLLDLATVGEVTGPNYDLSEVLEACEVTEDGLNKTAQQYLQILARYRGAMGKQPLAEQLGEQGDGLAELERLLMDKGLVGKTPRGRELTREGIVRAKALAA